MPKKSARQWYEELSDLHFSRYEKPGKTPADEQEILDILESKGYDSDFLAARIDLGLSFPGKKHGGQIGKPRGWGKSRYGNK
jgi:hypothetical protein